MFGKRSGNDGDVRAPKPAFQAPEPAGSSPMSRESAAPTVSSPPLAPAKPPPAPTVEARRSDNYYQVKATIFGALIEAIDLPHLSKLDVESAREEIRDIVNDIIAIKNFAMTISEQEELLEDICNDVLGYGPLEPLLARDDIADIMVNGAGTVFIEVAGKIQRTGIRFRDNQQLLNICQRIVSQVGRRGDESSPICDARLADVRARLPGAEERKAIAIVVIGGQLFSKSFLGYTTYKVDFATKEGLLPAILLLLLPFAILWVLVKILPPWEGPHEGEKAAAA